MKKNLLLLFFMISIIGYSQIPAYYNNVNLNLSGQALKNELGSKVTNTHTTSLTYTPGVWDALKQTDLDPTDPTKVLLVYGFDDTDGDITNDRSRGRDMNGGSVGDWNREHVYPRSLGNPNLGSEGPGSDAHSLRPSDGQRNSSRSNRKFAAGTGNSGATAQGHWYPGDEWKGDVARMMMYMYIRYGDRCLPINVGVGNVVAGDTNMIDLFLQWNAEDPVSDFEKQRNPILETLQGNRNPFIDNPAFATQVWGGPQAEDLFNTGGGSDTEVPTTPTNLVASNIATYSANISWTASTDNVGVTAYNIYKDGVFLVSNTSTSYTITGLSPNTAYAFYVEARDAAGNVSAASNTANFTTQDVQPGGDATDLFFSEYIEGSSFNKALEIANFTGAPVNLSTYTIKKQTNGAGAWSGGLSLSGTLVSGDVYIVAHSSSSTTILNVADIFTGSSEVTFNGNDAIGLFKNNVLIDIIGTFNGGTGNFAQNTTLVRKATVSSPVTTYDVTQWNSFPSDTFTDLDMHTFNGGGPAPDIQAPTIPASLVAANITENAADLSWTASTDNVGVTGYDVYQDGILVASTAITSYSATGLTAETAYAFTVTAKDAAGNTSAASNAANVTTTAAPDTIAPTVPASLVAANITENAADLSWTASTDNVGVTGYDVYQDGVLVTSVTTTNYNVTGLTAETAYAFTVTAKDAAGNTSAASNAANVTTTASPDTIAPTVPASLVAANITENAADLSWTASTDNVGVTGYDVYQDGVLVTSVTTTNYNVTGLTAETAYAFTVTAKDAAGNTSAASNAANVTTTASPDTIAPTVPAGLVAANITENAADLSWTASTDNVGVTGYDVYQDGVLVTSVTTTNYNVTGLAAETAYAFTVAAKDAAGNTSAASNAANVTTTAAPDTIAPTAPASLVAANITENAADLSWTASTDNVGVTGYDVYQDGVLVASTAITSYSATGLTAETAYAFTVTAKDAAGNTSAASNVANVTTTAAPSGGNATDLFFSEYIEGSSFNKAVEIANFTGTPIDLSAYTIKKQTNGAGAWSGGLNLTGTLANSDVYIVGHNSSATAIQNVSNVLTASAEITFNGNDAVGLFKNGVLIDIIGTFNGGTANFAKDVTLIRKATVSSPTTTYAVAEWDTFAKDTFTNLDTHTFNGGGSGSDTQAPTAPASLVAANITENVADLSWTASTDNVGVTEYDVYQDGVLLGSTITTNYNVVSLSAQTAYIFEVIAKDAANNESLPATVNVTTQGTPTGSTTILHEGFFENGFDGWIDGGGDCNRYSGSRSFEGSYSIRLRDNSGVASSMTLENIDVSSYDTVEIAFHFYSFSMENNEDFWVRYHDGSSWITVATYARGTDFQNNNFYSATVTLDKASYTFANNARFRFQNDASGNGDHIYIDQVSIKGITNGAAARQAIASKEGSNNVQYIRSLNDVELESEEDFIIATNPVVGNTLQVRFYGEGTPKFQVINLLGQVVKTGNLNNEFIDVSNLRTGIYILELNDGDESMTKKFIKNN